VSRQVRFAPQAERDLTELFDYIASAAAPEIAARYVDELISCCESQATFPTPARRATTSAPDF
jgi:toxin ParE1/3/4